MVSSDRHFTLRKTPSPARPTPQNPYSEPWPLTFPGIFELHRMRGYQGRNVVALSKTRLFAVPSPIVEPVRVKVYGLFPRTRRRYVLEAVTGAVFGLFLFVAWWRGWPQLRQRLVALELPPLLRGIVAILDQTPRILLAAAVWK